MKQSLPMYPLKQGLKLAGYSLSIQSVKSLPMYPLKQGLKLPEIRFASECAIVFTHVSIKTRIETQRLGSRIVD